MRRPALVVALCFVLGLVGASAVRVEAVPVGLFLALHLGILLVASLGVWLARPGSWGLQSLLAIAILTSGSVRYVCETSPSADDLRRLARFDTELRYVGVVCDEPSERDGLTRATVHVEAQGFERSEGPVRGDILLYVQGPLPGIGYGDRVLFSGTLRAPRSARNPGAFDGRAYADLRGLAGSVRLDDPAHIQVLHRDSGHPFLSRVVLPVRRAARTAIERDLSGNPAALLKGLLLGDRQSFPQKLLDEFAATGLTHTLAVSGFNVGVIALVGFTFLRALSFGRVATALGVIPLLILYAFVTGLSPSVVRATFMACTLIVGTVLERDADVLNTLGVSALAILAIWPLSLFDPGFQLSFVATMFLIGVTPSLLSLSAHRSTRVGRFLGAWVCPALFASVAAQIGSIPIVAYHFQTLSLASFAANLPAAPLVSAATVLGVLTTICGVIHPGLSTLINGANYLVLKAMLGVVHLFSKIPYAVLTVPRPSAGMLLIYYLAVGLVLPATRNSALGKPILFGLLLSCNVYVWSCVTGPGPGLEVTFLDVGQGDSALIRFPDGKTMLVDGGLGDRWSDVGRRVIVPFLRFSGIRRVDVVVGTHPDNDHIGGLVEVLNQVRVLHYLDSGQPCSTWMSRSIRDLIARKSISYHAVTAGDSLTGLGNVGVLVLHPTSEFVSPDTSGKPAMDPNNGSVVLRLDYRGMALLLTGDVERQAESRLIAWGARMDCDVLKVAHHGSRTSSTEEFLAAVSPSIAVISAGEHNKFGHPSPEVIRRYKAAAIRLLRTDIHGAVLLRVDRRGLHIDTMLP